MNARPRQTPALPRAIARPLQEFLGTESAGGIFLLAAAAAALIWANVDAESYGDVWDTRFLIDIDVFELDLTLLDWVNEGLMAIFFFVVGMEIKRELVKGELADRRRAALPVAAALGGMVVPALIYTACTRTGNGADGWGIPMATDIAFAVGVLSLAGPRVPLALKVFLLALAIVDDLGAITVIAVFYTADVDMAWLAVAIGLFALTAALGRFGVKDVIAYLPIGVGAWIAVYESGVHPTVAGVVLGLLTPIEPHFDARALERSALDLIVDFRRGRAAGTREGAELANSALSDIEELARESQSVLDRLEHALHPWSSFLIIPIFGLANAGIVLNGDIIADAARSPISIGAALGLILGKPIGIALFAFVAVRLGFAALPSGVVWPQIAAVGMIAGIGFTVAIFISDLAFTNAALVDQAKIGVLAGSVLMGMAGFVALRRVGTDR